MFNALLKSKFNKKKYTTSSTEDKVIIKKPNKFLRNAKISISVYIVCATISFITAMYNDGKEALIIRRNTRKNHPEYIDVEDDDWILLRRTFENTIVENAFNSLTFPLGLVANIFPNIVLVLNPKNE